MKEGRKPECPEKTPDDELQTHTTNPHSSTGGRLGKHTC